MSSPAITPAQGDNVQPNDALTQQAASLAQPQPDQSAPAPAPAAAPAAPQKPSLWKNILHGALYGLENGGVPGALLGAADPKTAIQNHQNQQDMAQAKIKFANAQAAADMADATMKQQIVHNASREFQLKKSEIDERWNKDFMTAGIFPTVQTADNSHESAIAGLNTMGDAYQNQGGIPSHIVLNGPDNKMLAYDVSNASATQAGIHKINLMQRALGQTPYTAEQLLPKSAATLRNSLFKQSHDFFAPVPKNENDLQGLKAKYANLLVNAKALPASDPDRAELVSNLTDANDLLGAAQKNFDQKNAADLARKKDLAKTAAQTRTQGINEAKKDLLLGPDGLLHDYGWNEQTKHYDIDMGIAGSGQQGSRMAAAEVGNHLGQDVKDLIVKNQDKLGTLGAWVQSKGLNTPIADPDLARVQAALSSFAATQPALHAFRAVSAAEAFEHIIGGLQKDPQATLASIDSLLQTGAAVNPALRGPSSNGSGPFKSGGAAQPQAQPQKKFSISKYAAANPGKDLAAARRYAVSHGIEVIP